MRKKIIISLILIIAIIIGSVGWINYTEAKVKKDLVWFAKIPSLGDFEPITEDVKIKKFIKRSPKELVVIIQWKDKEALATIEHWITRSKYRIELCMLDEKNKIVMLE